MGLFSTTRKPAMSLALLATTGLWPVFAAAQPADAVWHCWLHEQHNLACLNTAAVDSQAATPTGPAALLRAIHEQPGRLRGLTVSIPLHTVPYEDSHVAELARSVLCGARRGCEAHYTPELAHLIAQLPESFADLHDPVLASAGS